MPRRLSWTLRADIRPLRVLVHFSERALPVRGGRAKPALETVGYGPKRSHRGEYIIPVEASGGSPKGYRCAEHRARRENRSVNGSTPHRRTMRGCTRGQTHRAATIPAVHAVYWQRLISCRNFLDFVLCLGATDRRFKK